MIAVIFEAIPHADQRKDYLDLAVVLREEVERVDGFISIERFESLSEGGKLLSLSLWRDEEAVAEWRKHPLHGAAQTAGHEHIFKHYRIRVASVLRDYEMAKRGASCDRV